MPRHTPPYPEEFRREAVRLAKLGGKPRWKLAKELGITDVTLRKWLRQDQAEEEARPRPKRAPAARARRTPRPALEGKWPCGQIRVWAEARRRHQTPYPGLTARPDRSGGPMSRPDRRHGTTLRTANNDGR